jgi:hypothetical protein
MKSTLAVIPGERPAMLRHAIRVPARALLPGLLLAACGGPIDVGLAPSAEEPLGTQEAALCSGLSVTNLTLNGISSYLGEMAGSGAWTVSPGAQGARLEFYVDGVLRSVSEEVGTPDASGTVSGSWYFSTTGIACGKHTFQVRAYPMVISSTGGRTTCFDSGQTRTEYVIQEGGCAPTTSVSCQRISKGTIRCTGSASGGTGSYTPYWQEYWKSAIYGQEYLFDWYQRPWTADFQCSATTSTTYYDLMQFRFQVVDNGNGMTSNVSTSQVFVCMPVA